MDIDLDQLRALMKSIQEFDVDELELAQGEERIVVRKNRAASTPNVVVTGAPPATAPMMAMPQVAPPAPAPPAPAPTAPTAPKAAAPAEDPSLVYVESPFVGTFYRSPSPDADAFVQVGQRIEPGTVLCIVEAMKLMNEIESEVAGTIIEVLAENGKPVEFGDRLFVVRP